MNKQMLDLDKEKREAMEANEKLVKEKEVLEKAKQDLEKLYEDAASERDNYKKDSENLKSQLDTKQEEWTKEVSSLQEAKDLLIQQKMELQADVNRLQGEFSKMNAVVEKTKQEADEVQKILRQDNSTLQDKLASQKLMHEALQKDKDEAEARFEMQSSLLSENLTTIRADFTVAESKVDELTKLNDQLRGEKLELEAKLEHNNDERRLLVDRCVASEKECEKLRDKVAEQRHKLDDMQAALQELGRENQTLQITTTKVQARKWLDDSEVTECTSCGKVFSVTVRKHHCRNCGHIFCNECSSRLAQVPTIKKPARVCDGCFTEINNKK
uniref:FYVE-type domain-containing protein n=1 Tax=Biomphalaria glabrata TaxID=6526 RepID=A0A2C9K1A3_BIOGL